MSGKEIAKLLCGACPPKRRRVLLRMIDTPDGVVFRSRYRAGRGRHINYDGVRLADMSEEPQWWGDRGPHLVEVRCPDCHHTIGVDVFALREIEAEYRATGRPVQRITDTGVAGSL